MLKYQRINRLQCPRTIKVTRILKNTPFYGTKKYDHPSANNVPGWFIAGWPSKCAANKLPLSERPFRVARNIDTNLTPTSRRLYCALWIGWFPAPGTPESRIASMFDLLAFWRNRSRWFLGARPDPAADSPVSGPDTRWTGRAGTPGRAQFRRRRNWRWRCRTGRRSADRRTVHRRWRTRTACRGSSRLWHAIAWNGRLEKKMAMLISWMDNLTLLNFLMKMFSDIWYARKNSNMRSIGFRDFWTSTPFCHAWHWRYQQLEGPYSWNCDHSDTECDYRWLTTKTKRNLFRKLLLNSSTQAVLTFFHRLIEDYFGACSLNYVS